MTKKHFIAIAIAKSIRAQIDFSNIALDNKYGNGVRATATKIAQDIAALLANDNPNFNARRFYAACGIKE